jgi:hypothetical protein
VIYRISSASREYLLNGQPGLDIQEAHSRFQANLSPEPGKRREQLLEVLAFYALGEDEGPDLEAQAFVAMIRDEFGLYHRDLTEITLGGPLVPAA